VSDILQEQQAASEYRRLGLLLNVLNIANVILYTLNIFRPT